MTRFVKILLTAILLCLPSLANAQGYQPFSFGQAGNVVASHAQPNEHSNPLASLTDAAVYWKFESSAGTDSTGHGNTLTSVGSPSYSAGLLGNALYAVQNGATKAYATAADSSSFKPGTNTAFSINFWARSPVAGNSGTQVVFLDRGNFGTGDAFAFYISTSNQVQVVWSVDGTNKNNLTPSSSTISANTWYMYTLVVTPGAIAGSGSGVFYINGASVASLSSGTAFGTGQAFTTFVGARGDGSTFPTDGTVRIDSFGFWGRVITSTEISLLYNSGAGADPF